MSSSVSPSVASTVPAAVWFSAASNVAEEENAGAALASVLPLPASDHVAGALVVGRPHLHIIRRVLRQAPDGRRQRRDRRAGHLRPRALRRGRPVAVVVVGDGRTGVGRLRPRHRQARHRRRRHRRRVRLAAGASPLTSVTVTVMVWVAVFYPRRPCHWSPSPTTTYWLLPAALAGSTLSMSWASSKLGASSNVSVAVRRADLEPNAWSAPPVIE